jgi:DNA-3-methyladenine glycosylase I
VTQMEMNLQYCQSNSSRKLIVVRRCEWVGDNSNPLDIKYHDEEWGVPVHDDRTLFEFLTLEGAQAGISWSTILNKRNNYRNAYDNFESRKVAKYFNSKQQELLRNEGIVRNRLKVEASVTNAKAFLEVQKEFGSFDKYIWEFVGNITLKNN